MKLKASVLGSVTRAVLGTGYLGAGEQVLVTHLLRGYFSFILSGSTAGLWVGSGCFLWSSHSSESEHSLPKLDLWLPFLGREASPIGNKTSPSQGFYTSIGSLWFCCSKHQED